MSFLWPIQSILVFLLTTVGALWFYYNYLLSCYLKFCFSLLGSNYDKVVIERDEILIKLTAKANHNL